MHKDKKILITGGTGFLGKAVVDTLEAKGYTNLLPIGSAVDLTCCEETLDFFKKEKPEVVLHLAATVGGIGANKDNPGLFMYNNSLASFKDKVLMSCLLGLLSDKFLM